MLTISDGFSRDCEGYSRRDMLRIGALGLGGLTLPQLLQLKAQATTSGVNFVKDTSVVFLFLHGGPSQTETWDPKMSAPANIRSFTGEVQTRLPGVTFGGTFPRLAAMADRLAIVRSFQVGTGNHRQGRTRVLSGLNPLEAPLGALYSRVAGSANPRSGMPNNIFLPPRAAGPEYAALRNDFNEINNTGQLSAEFRPFDPSAGNAANANTNQNRRRRRAPAPRQGLIADMQMRLPANQLANRRELLNQLGNLQRGLDRDGVGSVNQYRQQAFDVIMRGVSQAFDLSNESPRVLARYDTTSHRFPQSVLNKNSRNARRIPDFAPTGLGKQLLLARRLCEAGCGFVTVSSHGWDMHGNALGINDGFPSLGTAVDYAVSAFIEDLAARGLTDKILLVITGEMGRTPRINNKRGRDHWARLCSLALAGGGLRMGQVIGASDRQGGSPSTTPVRLNNLMGTIMHHLFDIGQLRVARGLPTDLMRAVNSAQPIRELV